MRLSSALPCRGAGCTDLAIDGVSKQRLGGRDARRGRRAHVGRDRLQNGTRINRGGVDAG
jgi:hypothetical protein